MSVTVSLPDGLLEDVQRLTGCKTKRGTVILALEELRKARLLRQRLIDRLGKTPLNLTQEDVRGMRGGRKPPPKDAPLLLIGPAQGWHRLPPKFIPRWDEDGESGTGCATD